MNVKVIGYDLKSLQVELMMGEQIYCERGALIYYEEGIDVVANILGSGGIGGLLKRAVSGESLIHLHLRNSAGESRKLMLAGRSGMLPLDLKTMGGGLICRGGYYIAATEEPEFDFKLSLGSYIGGTGLALQKLRCRGTVFIDSIGTAVKVDLVPGQSILVDEKSFVCMSILMEHQLTSNYSIRGLIGGEGINMMRIAGPGTVYINSANTRP